MTATLLAANAVAWIALAIGCGRHLMWTMRLWETLVRVTFGTFMGGLVLLLILLYSGVPIV